jgi:hypothetical protein
MEAAALGLLLFLWGDLPPVFGPLLNLVWPFPGDADQLLRRNGRCHELAATHRATPAADGAPLCHARYFPLHGRALAAQAAWNS